MGDESQLVIAFPEVNRVVSSRRSPIGTIRQMEGTGKYRRDTVRMAVRRELSEEWTRWRYGNGQPLNSGQIAYVVIERSRDVIRVLSSKDEQRIAAIDAEEAELRRQIGELRKQRTAAVSAAWRRAAPLTPAALKERAEAELKARRQRAA